MRRPRDAEAGLVGVAGTLFVGDPSADLLFVVSRRSPPGERLRLAPGNAAAVDPEGLRKEEGARAGVMAGDLAVVGKGDAKGFGFSYAGVDSGVVA